MKEIKDDLPAIVTSILGVLLAQDPAGAALLSGAATIFFRRTATKSREILMGRVRDGDIEAVDKDELLSMFARFLRSVQEGVAKQKLILLARLISSIGRVDKDRAKAETFNQYADMLERLTEEEIDCLATCIRTGNIKGDEEILQSLQYKGILTSSQIVPPMIKIRRWGPSDSTNESNTTANVHTSPQEPARNKTIPEYSYTTRFRKFLDTYGRMWDAQNDGIEPGNGNE